MLFKKDASFEDALQSALDERNFTIKEQRSEQEYLITNGAVEELLDVTNARQSFDQERSCRILEEALMAIELNFTARQRLVSFEAAQSSLRMLLVRRNKITDDFIAVDFLRDMKKVVAFTTDNQNVFPLSSAYARKWDRPESVLYAVAERNMSELLRRTELTVSSPAGGIKVLEFFVESVQMRASLQVSSEFYRTVSSKLGSRFLIVCPSAESMIALQDVTNNIVESFGPVVLDEYLASSMPLTTDVFRYSPTGITVIGHFRTPEEQNNPSYLPPPSRR